MTELDELPEPAADTRKFLRGKAHTMGVSMGKTAAEVQAEAYKLWLEAERDRRQQEGE